ncbi:MAG: hypothetical protein BalsKO_29560 [Balneolaceae bacterium]
MLKELGKIDERAAMVVEMKFFGGMRINQIAEILGVSEKTVLNEIGKKQSYGFILHLEIKQNKNVLI